MTDGEWEDLLGGDPRKAFSALVEAYGGYVYAIVAEKLGGEASKEDIEDCVGDVFVEIFKAAERFSSARGSLKGFVAAVAKRRAIDAFRRRSYRSSKVVSSEDEAAIELAPAPEDAAAEAEERLLRKRLWDEVKALGEPDSSIIIDRYFYKFETADIARRVGLSQAAVRKRIQRARKKLKKALEDLNTEAIV